MLDYILILGQVPGTNYQVSFGQVIIGSIGIWLTLRIWHRPALRRKYAYWFRVAAYFLKHFRVLRRLQN